MINQKWLHTFMTLATTKHFTLTAKQLFMTQPGVTQHIQKLESQLNVNLLNRYGKQFELTLAGEKLFDYGLKLAEMESEMQQSITSDDPLSGQCIFSCSGNLAIQLYPQFLTHQQQYPELIVSLEAAPNKSIIQGIIDNTIDVGVVTQAIEHTALQQTVLGYETLKLVCAKQHNLTTFDKESINRIGFINHPDGLQFLTQLLEHNPVIGLTNTNQIRISSYVNQLSQILLPVSLGLGFTVLPENTIAHYQDNNTDHNLQVIDLPNSVNEPFYLTQKRHKELPLRYQWFTHMLSKLFQ